MTTKQLSNLINRLQTFNDWRRGKVENYPIKPAQIGKDLDKAIEILEDCLEISKRIDCINIFDKPNKEIKPPEFITKRDYYN